MANDSMCIVHKEFQLKVARLGRPYTLVRAHTYIYSYIGASASAGHFRDLNLRLERSIYYTGTLNGVAPNQTGRGGEGSQRIISMKNDQGRRHKVAIESETVT